MSEFASLQICDIWLRWLKSCNFLTASRKSSIWKYFQPDTFTRWSEKLSSHTDRSTYSWIDKRATKYSYKDSVIFIWGTEIQQWRIHKNIIHFSIKEYRVSLPSRELPTLPSDEHTNWNLPGNPLIVSDLMSSNRINIDRKSLIQPRQNYYRKLAIVAGVTYQIHKHNVMVSQRNQQQYLAKWFWPFRVVSCN